MTTAETAEKEAGAKMSHYLNFFFRDLEYDDGFVRQQMAVFLQRHEYYNRGYRNNICKDSRVIV